ncbi:ribonuclease R [Maridesulfovibrio ferrireducens]|uniref:Ribonuclease R n=1 Tax=Maridesulfovibrio ferrireducens TaxID=246191 RepID=A0A1G9J0Y2_9BACT|nr:ribonuclease R [Maridesulfovibrio ferrireducens]SDL30981.1 ribonuclease R [Maridesulfovibrio ferrireducens]
MGKKKHSKNPGVIKPYEVVKILRKSEKPLSGGEIQKRLGLTKRHRKFVKELLVSQVAEGKIVKAGSAYGLLEKMNMITGKLQVQRSGAAFVLPDEKGRKDIFVRPRSMNEAWHGDRVSVAILSANSGGKNPEGRVLSVLERGKQVFPVRVARATGATALLCNPTDPKLNFGIVVEPKEAVKSPSLASGKLEKSVLNKAGVDSTVASSKEQSFDYSKVSRGDILLVAPGERIHANLWKGKILKYLGREDDVLVQEAIVKANNGVPTEFPEKALEEAASLPDRPSEEDFESREDMREIQFVTIDGATAKDFDDAIHVETIAKGYRLRVAIADVSHYVAMNSPMDREAGKRANSYYFPKSVEPMFPEALSNGLCSLNPNVERLAMNATIEFDKTGVPLSSKFASVVIRSHARLTYNQVYKAIIQGDEEERAKISEVVPMLEVAEKLALQINARRKERGSLDFDLPEPEILFNLQGETVDICPRVRNFAHQMIEEFMIAANEAVAEFLTAREMPCLYRVHPGPDPQKLTNFFKVLKKMGIASDIPDPITPQSLQKVLQSADGADQEFLVSRMLIRSMKQAKYEPGNEGHFGLASDCYCHFTSPIRRYADLAVHRSLKVALGDQHQPMHAQKQLTGLGSHLSARERVAMEAEREILKRLTIIFLKDKVGEQFTGIISSMAEFGFWVEFQEVMAEGMIRLASLSDDYYTFWADRQMIVGERSGKAFRLGQKVIVKLDSVSLELLEANLSIVEGGEDFKKYV